MKQHLQHLRSIMLLAMLTMFSAMTWAQSVLTEIHAEQKEVTLAEGDSLIVNVFYAPADAQYKYIGTSSNSNCLAVWPVVTESGEDYSRIMLYGYFFGKYKVILTAINNESVADTIYVNVTQGGNMDPEPELTEDIDDEYVPESHREINLAAPNKQYVDIDFTGQSISISNLNLQDNEAVTAFLQTYVPEMSRFTFERFRQNTDIKGFTHIDYKQVDPVKNLPIDGSELTIHHDSNGKLLFITGNVAPEPAENTLSVKERKLMSAINFDPNVSAYTQKAELTGDFYSYPKDVITSKKTLSGATDGKGTYVLQDPGRLYTLDYSGVSGDYARKHPTLAGILAAGTNFDSKTAEYSTGYKYLKSQVDRISYPVPGLFENLSFNIEIRKCTHTEYAEPIEGWSAGTTVATAAGKLQNDSVHFDFDNLTFEIKARNQDNVAETMSTYYLAKIKCGDEDVDNFVLPMQHLDYDSINVMGKQTCVRRHLVERQPALDLHWGMERVLDVYKESFNIDSYDNQGSPVISLVNQADGTASNAAYTQVITDDGCAVMMFGLGCMNPVNENYVMEGIAGDYPFTQIEIAGHEFTHAIAGKMTSFVGENLALNESYADIMGLMVRRKVLDSNATYSIMGEPVHYADWAIGGLGLAGAPDVCTRRFDELSNDPKFYKGQVWNSKAFEQHSHAAVQNHWFYLLCTGGSVTPEVGEPVTITPISRDDAELITFSALMYFSFKNMDYPKARRHSIHAAQMYFGNDSDELKAVYSAWYAVGVGQDEWQPGLPTSIHAINNVTDNSSAARKILKDGKLVIVKNGTEYTTAGARVK